MSHITCHIFIFFLFFFHVKKIGQGGGASRWRVCYQRGLPRLVFAMGATIRPRQEILCLQYAGYVLAVWIVVRLDGA